MTRQAEVAKRGMLLIAAEILRNQAAEMGEVYYPHAEAHWSGCSRGGRGQGHILKLAVDT